MSLHKKRGLSEIQQEALSHLFESNLVRIRGGAWVRVTGEPTWQTSAATLQSLVVRGFATGDGLNASITAEGRAEYVRLFEPAMSRGHRLHLAK
jgi:hypothetical protein